MIVTRTLSAAGTSDAVILDGLKNPFNVTLAVAFLGGVTASAVKVQFAVDDEKLATDTTGTGLTWVDHATLTGLTQAGGTAVGNLAFPVTAVRLVAGTLSGGTVNLLVNQAGC